MSKKKLAGLIAVCVVVIVVVVLAITQSPHRTPQTLFPKATLVTGDCTDHATTSLKAQANVTDDGGDWITRRGFQYSEGSGGGLGDIIPLVDDSFEQGDPPEGWVFSRGSGVRSDVQKKLGLYSCALTMLTMNESEPSAAAYQNIPNYKDYIGKTVRLGAWVYATEAQQARLFLSDGVQESDIYHSGVAGWEFLVTPPMTVQGNATQLQVVFFTYSTTVAYVDGVIVVEGDELLAVFEEGEFGTGPYSLNITGLKPNTSYRVRAFAENKGDVGYGRIITCKTALS
jgi:hypothetical protein